MCGLGGRSGTERWCKGRGEKVGREREVGLGRGSILLLLYGVAALAEAREMSDKVGFGVLRQDVARSE